MFVKTGIACILLTFIFSISIGVESTETKSLPFNPQTTLIGTIPRNKKISDLNLQIRPDGQEIAFIEYPKIDSQKYKVHYRGKKISYDNVWRLEFSPNSKDLIYWAKQGAQYFVVKNGREGKKLNLNSPPPLLVISAKGTVAYLAEENKKYSLYINDQKVSSKYEFEGFESLGFSPDGNFLAYGFDKIFVRKDDQETSYPGGEFKFSKDSQFLIIKNEEAVYVLDLNSEKMKQLAIPKNASYSTLSPDKNTLASLLFIKEKVFLKHKGKNGKKFKYHTRIEGDLADELVPPTFSPDGKRIAFGTITKQGDFMVVDGQAKKKYFRVGNPVFSPDSNHFAYLATRNSPDKIFSVLVLDDEKLRAIPNNFISAPTFSPDSKNIAYIEYSGTSGKDIVFINNTPGKAYDQVFEPLRFSSDGKHLGYDAAIGNQIWWIVHKVK